MDMLCFKMFVILKATPEIINITTKDFINITTTIYAFTTTILFKIVFKKPLPSSLPPLFSVGWRSFAESLALFLGTNQRKLWLVNRSSSINGINVWWILLFCILATYTLHTYWLVSPVWHVGLMPNAHKGPSGRIHTTKYNAGVPQANDTKIIS